MYSFSIESPLNTGELSSKSKVFDGTDTVMLVEVLLHVFLPTGANPGLRSNLVTISCTNRLTLQRKSHRVNIISSKMKNGMEFAGTHAQLSHCFRARYGSSREQL